ncbi:MAG: hypothetical protein ACP5T3_00305 [Candidatus Micrarchaeia archaeon]
MRASRALMFFVMSLLLLSLSKAGIGIPTIYSPVSAQAAPTLANSFDNALMPVCSSMIAPLSGLGGSYSALLSISLAIVFMVLTILGVVYAIGRAFGIPVLMEFVKKEYLESIFNIVLIVIAAGGLGFADASVSFLSNLALSSSATGQASVSSISSANSLYLTLCNTYLRNGITYGLVDIVVLVGPNIIDSSMLQNLRVSIGNTSEDNPLGVSVSFSPFAGIYPYVQVLSAENNAVYAMIAVYLGISFLLAIIYGIFPLLFYAGILLRSFPWTRAAGGALLALFISFFIVFPSILFAFANAPSSYGESSASIYTGIAGFFGTIASFFGPAVSGILAGIGATSIISEMESFVSVFAYGALQLLGLIVALLVSFDLLESLGDLLGAPSLQSRSLLKNVI